MAKINLRERLEKINFFEEEAPQVKEKIERPVFAERGKVDDILYNIKTDADKILREKQREENLKELENSNEVTEDKAKENSEISVSEDINETSDDTEKVDETKAEENTEEKVIDVNDIDFQIHKKLIDEEEYFKDCRELSDDEINGILVDEEDDYEITEQDLIKCEEFLKDLK